MDSGKRSVHLADDRDSQEVRQAFRGQRAEGPVEWEEEGTLWLWAWPELLGWPRPISWLFSPVVGRHPPGDLWGVDDAGHLVAVETKRAKKARGKDPFEDFLDGDGGVREIPSVEKLRAKWQDRLEKERSYLAAQRENLSRGRREKDTFTGVVPYSTKRFIVWQWRELYCAEIAPQLETAEYERQVRLRLRRRQENRQNTTTHFVGLFTVLPMGTPTFSKAGRKHREGLTTAVGDERVHVRAVEAARRDGETVFRSWKPAAPSP